MQQIQIQAGQLAAPPIAGTASLWRQQLGSLWQQLASLWRPLQVQVPRKAYCE